MWKKVVPTARQALRHAERGRQVTATSSYHSKVGVYGYNAPLHNEIKEKIASTDGLESEIEARRTNPNLYRYVEAYRLHGHKSSHINPTKQP